MKTYSAKNKLSDDLRLRCSKLFIEHNARVIEECEYSQGMGHAWVVMLIENMWFRCLCRDGLFFLQVRDVRGVDGWELLDKVIVRITGRDTKVVPLTWEQWCELFVAHCDVLS